MYTSRYTVGMDYSKRTLIASAIGLLAIGFIAGRALEVSPLDSAVSKAKEVMQETLPDVKDPQSELPTQTAPSSQASTPSATKNEVLDKVVDVARLTPNQKKMLESFGIDTTSLTVTAQMISCAQEKLGKTRLEEIMAGATPSFLEGASLFGCYTQ
jgi:hypothetical protein